MSSSAQVTEISDLHVFPLEWEGDRLTLLSEDQHLLRRFGQLQLVSLQADESSGWHIRGEADEFWFPLSGVANIELVDQRPQSPSIGLELSIELNADHPEGLLLPFGVAYRIISQGGASLLRLSTHLDGDHRDDADVNPDQFIKPAG